MNPNLALFPPSARAILQRHARAALVTLALASGLAGSASHGAESGAFPAIYNSGKEAPTPLLKPEEATQRMQLPPGFRATLFAGEPDVQQPIAMTTDARGRLWVAENYTYAEQAVNFDLKLRDRIVILEDTDHDGHFDKRTVFWDRGQKLTSVAVGFGGVFALCPPRLLFIPDRDGDDVPDGEPVALLDGFEADSIRHNIANGLKWGPDGWLYGRHGIQASSHVGAPGDPPDKRTTLNAGIWRFHPVTHAFEVVAQGTTNPWGHDWDENGELFFINTVIGHLWHAVPGAYYKRMYGQHADPYLYELLDQTADHLHWDAKESWSDIRKLGVTPTTSQAGGGHAHSGLMIYLGDNWPARYHNTMFTVNLHGRRLNNDTLERRGATYVGRHAADFMTTDDVWFRGLDLLYGPDGGVYLSDWSDVGECHNADGINRTSGRIYKITYDGPGAAATAPLGRAPRPPGFGLVVGDLAKLPDADLVRMQLHPNDWYARQARQLLQERAAGGAAMSAVHAALRQMFETQTAIPRQLRALWSLNVTGGADEAWLRTLLRHQDEHVRVWAIRLLIDQRPPSAAVAAEFAQLAKEDSSGLVQTYLASAMQRIPAENSAAGAESLRWPIARALAARPEFAADPVLPLMLWYGIEPAVPKSPEQALALARETPMRKVRHFTARRVTEDLEVNPAAVNRLVQLMGERPDAAFQSDILSGMEEALTGWGKAAAPPAWAALAAKLNESPDENVRRLARTIGAVFGDGRAADELRALLARPNADVSARRRAMQTLVQSRAEGVVPLLRNLFTERDLGADAVRGLATLGVPETPKLLLDAYPKLRPEAQAEAVNALASRPAFAGPLLEAVENHRLPKGALAVYQVRQLRNLNDDDINRRLGALWPELRPLSASKQQLFTRYKGLLTPERLAAADRAKGRQVFAQTCGLCHTLFGQGGAIGPDLTGSDRRNLDYLLDNVIDPNAVVPEPYRISTVRLKDGRVITGIAGAKTERTLVVQTPSEKLTLDRADVTAVEPSLLSLMPEGLLESFTEEQARDLVAYLMSTAQVPLPEAAANSK